MTNTLSIEYNTVINKKHPHFKGHFKHFPVFPGVSQINLIKSILIKETNNLKLRVIRIKKCKFTNLIRPNYQVIVQLNVSKSINLSLNECHWIIKGTKGETFSKGILFYE